MAQSPFPVSFTFGKHRGKSFEEVRLLDPGYVLWAKGENPGPGGRLYPFVQWCLAKESAWRGQAPKRTLAAPSLPEAKKASRSDEPRSCEKCGSYDVPPWVRKRAAVRCGPCWKECFRSSTEAFYLRCPIEEKSKAKERGAFWDDRLKKWYVPAGKDVSLFEAWFVRCVRCGEGLSDDPELNYDPSSATCPPQCVPECPVDRQRRAHEEQQRKMAELARLRKEEAEKRLVQIREEVKAGFLQFLRQEAVKTEKLMRDRSTESDAVGPLGGLLESLDAKIEMVKQLETSGGNAGDFFYNPFQEGEGIASLSSSVVRWLRSFGEAHFSKQPGYVKRMDFRAERIFDWALTFYHFFLDQWISDRLQKTGNQDARKYVATHQELISHWLLQSMDAVTPDLKVMIEETLRDRYKTTCPDIVAIFGSKILPRVRTSGEEVVAKEDIVSCCVLEYMRNRKGYDRAHNETEETTYMRDVLNVLLEELLRQPFGHAPARRCTRKSSPAAAAPLLCREVSSSGTDALFFANPEHPHRLASAGKQCFMLRQPNTGAADLFDWCLMQEAALAMTADPDHGGRAAFEVPEPAAFRRRIFALFRTLHFRIDRKVANVYGRYGLDEGLREGDKDRRVAKVKQDFPHLHSEMLEHNWTVRDYVGFKEKRLHSNTDLIQILCKHLDLDQPQYGAFMQAAHQTATRRIDEALAMREKHHEALEAAMSSSHVRLEP